MKTVKEKFANTLNDFAQSKSDAVNIEASQFEQLEKDYRLFIEKDLGEDFIIDLMNQMCEESLNPESFYSWESIKKEVKNNRNNTI